jgi:hypothetical protein
MKKIIITLLSIMLLTPTVLAETRVRLDARFLTSAQNKKERWKSDYSRSSSHDYNQERQVIAKIECTSGGEAGRLVIFWLAHNRENSSETTLHKVGVEEIQLAEGQTIEKTLIGTFAGNIEKWDGRRERTGISYRGWVIRVIGKDGQVLAEKSSSQPYLKKFPISMMAEDKKEK